MVSTHAGCDARAQRGIHRGECGRLGEQRHVHQVALDDNGTKGLTITRDGRGFPIKKSSAPDSTLFCHDGAAFLRISGSNRRHRDETPMDQWQEPMHEDNVC